MADADLDAVIEGIDRHLDFLHKEHWAIKAAQLRRTLNAASEAERDTAQQALNAHLALQDLPQTSRAALIEEATRKHAGRSHP